MPHQVRIISRPIRDFDDHVRHLVEEDGYGVEREYYGITTRARADEVRRGMRTAGRHLGVSVRSYWRTCDGCELGGESCAYHVRFTAYDPARAREYMARKSKNSER